MSRPLILLVALTVLSMHALAVPTLPESESEPTDLRDSYNAHAADTAPGAQCLELALAQYRLVLTDPDNRADHFYLAQTYEALSKMHLAC